MPKNNKSNLLAVVLCGGESKRMGSDKGLLQLDGETWTERIAKKLEKEGLAVFISINESQQERYSEIFKKEELVVDQLPMHGPLNGLLTVHQQNPERDILLVACDLIDMDKSTLEELINSYEKNEADYFAYEEENFFQPLCAIYTATALQSLLQRLISGSLANYSFQYILNNSRTYRLYPSFKKAFENHNTP